MKWLFFALPIILLMLMIGSNELSSNDKEKKESYEACIKLKKKAPYFNLKCEHLLPLPKSINIAGNKNIKTLYINESNIRKVSKIEENKLKKLMQKLSNEGKLRKD
jgi:hypothetical protein